MSPENRNVLTEADSVVTERGKHYGPPHINHARTAGLWSEYLGMRVTPRDVCMLNVLQKIGRDRHRPKRDNLVDICGFVRNIELAEPVYTFTHPEMPNAGACVGQAEDDGC